MTNTLKNKAASSRSKVKAYKPSPAQCAAGNYPKLFLRPQKLRVTVENPAGSYREDFDSNNKTQSTEDIDLKGESMDFWINLKCIHCGKTRSAPRHRLPKNSDNWVCMGCKKITLTCRECGKQVRYSRTALPKSYNGNDSSFRCLECKRTKIKVTCPTCNKVREVTKSAFLRMRSHTCRRCYLDGIYTHTFITCPQCGKVRKYQKLHADLRHTDLCVTCSKLGENSHRYIDGRSRENGYNPKIWKAELKDTIRAYAHYKCSICGKVDTLLPTGKNKALAVHHIDYCKDNYSEDNLLAMCNSCHAKTGTNRDYWQEVCTDILKQQRSSLACPN